LTIILHDASLLSRRSTKASQSTAGRSEAGQSFGGGKLVAAEETRSSACGDHAKLSALHESETADRILAFHRHPQLPLHHKVTTPGKRLPLAIGFPERPSLLLGKETLQEGHGFSRAISTAYK
jgi:hypothetical protein